MAKYADIEPFYDWLVELMRMDTSSHPDHQTLMFYEILDELDGLPEIVLCKDCRHYQKNTCPKRAWAYTKQDDFCSYGEKKNN